MIITRTEISQAVALQLVTESISYANAKGWQITAAVADPRGTLVALLRTDDVVTPAVDFAVDKAYTAATLRCSTKGFYERAETNSSLKLGLTNRPRLMVWTGGLPLFHNGACIGGLGVSGAQDFEDEEIALAAISMVGLTAEAH